MPPHAASPVLCYLICASQRSGTTLLHRALTDTGIAGRPDEYFLAVDEVAQPEWAFSWEHGPFAAAHGVADRPAYLELVYRLGTTPNGVFGAKLMWNNLPWAIAKFQEMPRFSGLSRAEVFHEAFPNLRAIHVTRRDRIAQAVSWARMAQDGVSVVSEDEPARPSGEPRYDPELIGNLEGLIREGEQGWRTFFDELGLTPLELVYEDFVFEARWEPTIRSVLSHLELDADAVPIPRPRTKRQADALNADWIARYTA